MELRKTIEAFSDSLVRCPDREDGILHFVETTSQQLYGLIKKEQTFQKACQSELSCSPENGKPWDYQMLGETSQLRVGVLTLFRLLPISMHDHAGSHGAQLVLRGEARMCQYDYLSDSDRNRRMVTLERKVDRIIEQSDWVCYTADRLNIHEFEAQSERIVIFSVMFSPPSDSSRSWFFPADPFDDSRRRLYRRMKIGISKRSGIIS